MCPKIEYQNLMVKSIMAFIFAMEIAILVAIPIFSDKPSSFQAIVGPYPMCFIIWDGFIIKNY